MKKIIVGLFALVFAVQAQAEFKAFKVVASQDGATIAVDPFMLFHKAQDLHKEIAKEKTAYVEYIAFPKSGYNVYADATEGVADVPQTVVIEEKVIEQSFATKAGAWAWQNRGKIAMTAGTAVGSALVYQYKNDGWPFASGDDKSSEGQNASRTPANTSSESTEQTQLNNSPIISVDNSGAGDVTINITTAPAAP